MYKLQNLNIVIETDDEMKKNELISIGYELVDEVENSNMSTADATNETSENEITKNSDISEDEEQSEEENKAGKKSKAKK
jgi:hypothetical protein